MQKGAGAHRGGTTKPAPQANFARVELGPVFATHEAMLATLLVPFSLPVPCAHCGARWDVEVHARVTPRDAGCDDVTVADEYVFGSPADRAARDCARECPRPPVNVDGLMAARNSREHGDDVEAAYFAAAAAAYRRAAIIWTIALARLAVRAQPADRALRPAA